MTFLLDLELRQLGLIQNLSRIVVIHKQQEREQETDSRTKMKTIRIHKVFDKKLTTSNSTRNNNNNKKKNKKTLLSPYHICESLNLADSLSEMTPTPKSSSSSFDWNFGISVSGNKKRRRHSNCNGEDEDKKKKKPKLLQSLCDNDDDDDDNNDYNSTTKDKNSNLVTISSKLLAKLETVKYCKEDDCIVMIQASQIQKGTALATLRNKLEALNKLTALEFGHCDMSSGILNVDRNEKMFLYLTRDSSSDNHQYHVVGCVIVHEIRSAYRIIQNSDLNDTTQSVLQFDLSKKERALLCIDKIWCSEHFRRSRIATTLVTTAREFAIWSFRVARKYVAISEPTDLGRIFFRKYSRRPDFLVHSNRKAL